VYFIEDGAIEFYTKFEGNEFILERLHQGSCINFRAFFMDDLMYVYTRCCRDTMLLELDKKTIDFIKTTHADFEKQLLSY
jgi:CRP-like cAMP-binding protein